MMQEPSANTPAFLIVDDDPLIVHSIARALRPLGKVSFTNAFDKVHVTAAMVRPRVMLIDLDLPEVTGLEIARAIRTNPDLDATRILLMTAHNTDALLKEGEELTGSPVLRKPINLDSLVELMKTWV